MIFFVGAWVGVFLCWSICNRAQHLGHSPAGARATKTGAPVVGFPFSCSRGPGASVLGQHLIDYRDAVKLIGADR